MEKEFFHTVERDTVYLECGCEHTLPDYQGDIKKILSHKARVVLNGKYVSGSEIEYAGTVKFSVSYLDSDGKLTTSEFSTDIENSFEIDEERYADSGIEARLVNYSVRPSGPRKFSAKATLGCQAIICERASLCISGDGLADGMSPEMLEHEVEIRRSMWGKSGEVEYSDELGRINDVAADDIEILAISGEVKVNEARATVGGVIAVGTLELTAIISTPEQPAFAIRKSVPFEELIPIDGAEGEMGAVAYGELQRAETSLTVEEDGDVAVGFVTQVEYTARADSNFPLTVVRDAYLTSAETTADYSDFKGERFILNKYVPVSISSECAKADCGCEGAHGIVSTNHSIKLGEASVSHDRVDVSGEITFSGIACQINEDGKVEYCNYKFTSPFSESVKLDAPLPEGARVACKLCGASSALTLDSTDAFGKCEAVLAITVSAPFVERVLTSAEKTEDITPCENGACVTVCFPDKDDTLWEIAKRYHTTVRDIAVNNSLAEETVASASSSGGLRSVKKLLIL